MKKPKLEVQPRTEVEPLNYHITNLLNFSPVIRNIVTSFILLAFSAFFVPVFAEGIVLSPPKFELDADPGQTLSGVIKITNQNATPLILQSEVKDFVASGETGQPSFVDAGTGNESISLASWITVNNNESLTILPNEKKEIPFTITVPKTAEPGGKYGTIFFFPPSEGGQVAVVQKIGSLILVRVSGEIKEEGKLATFGAYPKEMTGEEVQKKSGDFFFEKTPVNFALRYENSGNVQVKPQGQIEIYNMFGEKVAPAGILSVVNEAGVELQKEIVDYIPVNDGRGNVLAKSTRKFDATWEGTPYWYKEEDGTKIIKYKGFPIGFYKAKLTLTGAKGEVTTDSTMFFVFPWKEIFGGFFGAVILVFGFMKYRRWSRKRLEEEIRKQMGK